MKFGTSNVNRDAITAPKTFDFSLFPTNTSKRGMH